MKPHTFRDNVPKSSNEWFTPRKIGLLSVPVAISMLMMYCGQKVNSILDDRQKDSIEYVSPDLGKTEQDNIIKSSNEAPKNQVLMIYRVKKWDTLSQIAQRYDISLENILDTNTQITHSDSIHIDQAILIPYQTLKKSNIETKKTTQTPKSTPKEPLLPEKSESKSSDMRSLTMVFEGFTPRMKIDTQEHNKTTYAIGYGTNIGTLQTEYPFASYGKDVAEYLKKQWHSTEDIRQIMNCKKDISRSEARDLFEMRYVPRYQKMRAQCGKNWNVYPPVVRNMLVDMSYNMGEYSIFPNGSNPWFPDAVAALNRGDWTAYINAVVDSKYARDVGARRLGKWIALIVRDVLKGKTTGLSPGAIDMHSTYTVKHSRDLNSQIAKLD